MKRLPWIVGAVCGVVSAGAFEPNCAEAKGWRLNAEISDEFAANDLDRGKWDDWVKSFPGRSAGENAPAADCRTGFMFAPENVSVENGELVLTARFLDAAEKTRRNEYLKHAPYAVSICRSRRKQAYGYYEIRAKAPRARIVTMGVFPFGEKPSSPHRVKAKKTNAILAEEVKKFGNAVFVDITDRQITGPNETYPKSLANDFVNPTDAGYEIWASAIKPLFP